MGEVGVSRLSWVFNLSLVITGLCLLSACVSLGLILPGLLAKIGIAFGVVCSLSLSLVGVFPMNKIEPHAFAAMTYFRAGLVMVALFSLAIVFQPGSEVIISRWYAMAGLPPLLSFTAFLILARVNSQKESAALEVEETEREEVSLIVVAEWAIFITLVVWFNLIANGF